MSDHNGGKPMTPEEYHKVLSGLELENVYLISCSCKVDRTSIGTDSLIKLADEAECMRNAESDDIEVHHHFSLDALNRKTRKKALQIKCTYGVAYSSRLPISEEFFARFKVTSLPLNTWPFFREFVNNLTSRMYIPPLTLPLLKRPEARSTGASTDADARKLPLK